MIYGYTRAMEYDYPLLKKVFEHYYRKGVNLSNTKLYSCMHLLAPQSEMYKRFIEFGFSPQNITVLGKIYSSNKEVIKELRELGINTLQPEFSGIAFDVEHAKNCKQVANEIDDEMNNIILDDGGYLIHEARTKSIIFAVEQTSSGFRKLESDSPKFSIYNVARSKTKLTQESPLIARQVFERISDYAETIGIEKPKILIVGLGPIGEASFQVFKLNNANVTGLDIETSKSDLLVYLQTEKPDIVVGATGTRLISSEDLGELDDEHTYHFISVSSSDREFPVAAHRNGEAVHENVMYKNFVFVNNGFPITFKGSRNELTPVEIEKTIALLMGSVFHGVLNRTNCVGFIDVPDELQDLINS
jgi:S-adenosylhomocysteine hydrolase